MALTLSGPILYGFSLLAGTTTSPDFFVSLPGASINDSFYIPSRDFSEHSVETVNPYVTLANGVLYDPFQTYDTPKIDKPETYEMTYVGNGTSSSFTHARGQAINIESDVMSSKVYIFYVFPATDFSYYITWRAAGRILRISYTDRENYMGRVSTIRYTVIKDSSTYQNIGTFTGY